MYKFQITNNTIKSSLLYDQNYVVIIVQFAYVYRLSFI